MQSIRWDFLYEYADEVPLRFFEKLRILEEKDRSEQD